MNDPNDFVIRYGFLERYNGSDATVVIPEGVTSIETGAFSKCYDLKEVILPESTERICRSAFAYCTGMTDIRIPARVREIEEGSDFDYGGVFRGCSGLQSITVDPANEVYESPNNCNAIIKKKARTLVAGCKNTVIPDGVKRIAAEAFGRNNELTSIAIPDSVTYIGAAAFSGCRNLTGIHIPAKCKWGRDAFIRYFQERGYFGLFPLYPDWRSGNVFLPKHSAPSGSKERLYHL